LSLRFTRRRLAAAAVVTATALALVGCSSGAAPTSTSTSTSSDDAAWDSIVAKAEQEGSVTIYSSQIPQILQDAAAQFMQEYPKIKVNAVRLVYGDVMTRYDAELKSGAQTADILETPFGAAESTNPAWFEKLDDQMPNLADYDKKYVRDDKVVALNGFPYIIAYNTNTVKKSELPKTWKDLPNSKWKGKGVFTDPRTSAAYTSWVALMDKSYGDGYLKDWASMDWAVVSSGVTGAQQVAAGAYELAAPVVPTHLTDLVAQGAPIAYVMPTPVHDSTMDSGITAKAAHPNAAKVFLNWYMGKAGQTVACHYDMATNYQPLISSCQAKLPKDAVLGTPTVPTADATRWFSLLGLK
jgi:ABC-type Fe3+ transport system substrate-binding protein